MSEIIIDLPKDVRTDEEVGEYLLDHCCEDIEPALELFYPNDRANIDSNTINTIVVSGKVVTVTYEFEWSMYSSCRDHQHCGLIDGQEIKGRKKGRSVIFEEYIPPEPRSTHDEF